MNRRQVWLWGHVAGAHNTAVRTGRSSRLTPREACRALGIRNLVMAALGGVPAPPFETCAKDLEGLDGVVWSVRDDSSPPRDDLPAVLALAAASPHVVGGIVDDLCGAGRVSADEAAGIARRLHQAPRPLDLWGVVYDHELDQSRKPWLDACDVVTFWTSSASALADLEDNLAGLRTLTADKRRLLGVYLWDFPGAAPIPSDALRRSLDIGAKWSDRGALDGVVLLASSLCGMGLESEVIARTWMDGLGA